MFRCIVQGQVRKWGGRISKSENIKNQVKVKMMEAQRLRWLLEIEHVGPMGELEPVE